MTLEQKIENAAKAILQICDEAGLVVVKAEYQTPSMTHLWRILVHRIENLAEIRKQEELDAVTALSGQDLAAAEALKSRLLESL